MPRPAQRRPSGQVPPKAEPARVSLAGHGRGRGSSSRNDPIRDDKKSLPSIRGSDSRASSAASGPCSRGGSGVSVASAWWLGRGRERGAGSGGKRSTGVPRQAERVRAQTRLRPRCFSSRRSRWGPPGHLRARTKPDAAPDHLDEGVHPLVAGQWLRQVLGAAEVVAGVALPGSSAVAGRGGAFMPGDIEVAVER